MTKDFFNPIRILVMITLVGLSFALFSFYYLDPWYFIAMLTASAIISSSVHIADQWERAVVLRLGKYKGLRGPGLFLIVPIIDKVSDYIDQRIRVTEFKAEQTLTKDTVPVNVDAVVYWTVWDVEKAALEVQDYKSAI